LIARVTPFDLIGLKRSPDSEPTGTRPYRVGPTICFLPSFSSTRQPQETVILGLRRTCEFPQTTAIWFSDSAAIRAALHDYKCRGGAARAAEWIPSRYRRLRRAPRGRKGGATAAPAARGGFHLFAVSLTVPRRPFASPRSPSPLLIDEVRTTTSPPVRNALHCVFRVRLESSSHKNRELAQLGFCTMSVSRFPPRLCNGMEILIYVRNVCMQ